MRTEEEWKWGVENFRIVADYALTHAPELTVAIKVVNRFESHFINIAADRGSLHPRRRAAECEGTPSTAST